VADGRELDYVPLLNAKRHGPRPARLLPLGRRHSDPGAGVTVRQDVAVTAAWRSPSPAL
jgi:CelD/BcsL family acetyltransferase involved in cellulose biosynthesis